MANRKVNLFLVGAMRAGTTSLVDLLSKHPDIYVPPIKEPNYFTADLPEELYSPPKNFSIDRYFEKDFPKKRLHIAHVKKKEQYEKLYSGAKDEKYLLDASTAYLHAPGVAQRIYEYNPEAKIIVLLRDPIERLISHYKMDIGLGRKLPHIETLLASQVLSYHKKNLNWYDHLSMSFCKKQIFFYKELFNEVCIGRADSLADFSKILVKFLGLDLTDNWDVNTSNRSIKSDKLRRALGYYQRNIKQHAQNYIPGKIKILISRKLALEKETQHVLPEKLTLELSEIFNRN